ncbi:MAG: SlyX family protein [Pseudohongiellaceae bacterium]
MQDGLIELQSKLTFQEQSLAELNKALVSQQKQINHLQLQLKFYEDRLNEIKDATPLTGQDEKPPHY